MVTTLAPPVYTPSLTITVSPGLVTSAARWMVRQGAALVPAFASLPDAASTQWHALTQLPGGGAVTVMAAVPYCPSLVAVIVAEPAAFAVTNPLPLTLATPLLPLAHVTTRPDNALPVASLGVAVSCTV